MELISVTQEIHAASKRLNVASREIFTLARDKAESERVYRKALSVEIIMLRGDKVPVSIVGDIARGNLSDLKYERDLAQDVYRSALSSIESTKAEINALQSIAKYQSDI